MKRPVTRKNGRGPCPNRRRFARVMGGMLACLVSVGSAQAQEASPGIAPEDSLDVLARAAGYLTDAVGSEAWADVDASLGNVGAKRQAAEAMLAWLLTVRPELAGPDTDGGEALARLDPLIRSRASGRNGIAFGNWRSAFSGLYLLEKAWRGEADQAALNALRDGFEGRQNREGGFGHGSSMGITFYPTTLMVTTWLAGLSLGGCERLGVDVDPVVLEDALQLMRDVQAESGGFPYGGRPYKKGVEAGRTAGIIAALSALRQTDDPMLPRAIGYLRRNLDRVPDGHASPALHVFSGAIATAMLSDRDYRAYHESVLARVLGKQREDGSFDDIIPMSPDTLPLMSDDLTNRAYITALYACALAAQDSAMVRELAIPPERSAKAALSVGTSLTATMPSSLWEASVGSVESVVLGAEVGAAYLKSGELIRFVPATGAILSRDLATEDAERFDGGLGLQGGHLLLRLSQAEENDSMPSSMKELEAAQAEAASAQDQLVCYDLESGDRRWSLPAPPIGSMTIDSEGIIIVPRAGSLRVLDWSGNPVREIKTKSRMVNTAVVSLGEKVVAVAIESNLQALDEEGRVVWKRRSRVPRGVNPSALGLLSMKAGTLFVGGTDGRVYARAAIDGELLWQVPLTMAVTRLVAEDSQTVLCATGDGWVHRVKEGAVVWSVDIGHGFETHARSRILLRGDSVWVDHAGSRILTELDRESGISRQSFRVEGQPPFDIRDGRLVLAGQNHLKGVSLQ